MKEQSLVIKEWPAGTFGIEDGEQQALRVEVQDATAKLAARVYWHCAPGVSVDTHPVFAFCVKLSRPDMQFGVSWWRTDRYAAETAPYSEVSQNYWSTFPRLTVGYQPTTDWQLVVVDGTAFANPNFEGNWTDIGLVLLRKDANLQAGDHVWLKWAGAFPCRAAAENFFASGVVYDAPTPLFWCAKSVPMGEKPLFPVLPSLPIEESARRITNREALNMGKIPSEKVLIAPYEENASFCHHAALAFFKDKMFVAYSSHECNEDSAGQCVRVVSSEDFYHWDTPQVVGNPRRATYGDTGLLCSHLFATEEKLYLYCAEKEYYDKCFREDGSFYYDHYNEDLGGAVIGLHLLRYETADGVHWEGPTVVDNQQWTNEAPRVSMTGRLFAGAGYQLAITDDKKGFNFRKIGPSEEQCADARRRGAWMLTEASWYQTDDYIVHMFFRSNSGYLWLTESYDNGESWTDVHPTRLVADNTMPYVGRLPDGRYFFLGDPHWNNARFPLALQISEDGYRFTKSYIVRDEPYTIRRPGQAKEFQYAYPEVRIHGEYLYIAYSKGKEVMEVTRIRLSDI